MKLSHSSVSQIADALKPAIIEHIISDDAVTQALQDAVSDGIREIMGQMDDDLFFDIGMLIFDRIEIKWDMTFESVIECKVSLNVQEIGVILSALQLLDNGDENRIAKEYGSAPSLYNRLKEIYDQMDHYPIEIQHDPICEPSFWLHHLGWQHDFSCDSCH